jgi:hypothetical protein
LGELLKQLEQIRSENKLFSICLLGCLPSNYKVTNNDIALPTFYFSRSPASTRDLTVKITGIHALFSNPFSRAIRRGAQAEAQQTMEMLNTELKLA